MLLNEPLGQKRPHAGLVCVSGGTNTCCIAATVLDVTDLVNQLETMERIMYCTF